MKKAVSIIVLALIAGSLSGGPAHAANRDPALDPYALHSDVVGPRLVENPSPIAATAGPGRSKTLSISRASFTVTCSVVADNPHKSTGAGYAIYKTRVRCKGTGSYPSSVAVRVRGGLMWDSARYAGDTANGIKWSMLRSSDETKSVPVNNATNTFYTPRLGQKGSYFTGHYQGSSTVQITAPTGQKSGSDISSVQFIKF